MKVRCYGERCSNYVECPWWTWLYACVETRSLEPYVCPEHWDLFRPSDKIPREAMA